MFIVLGLFFLAFLMFIHKDSSTKSMAAAITLAAEDPDVKVGANVSPCINNTGEYCVTQSTINFFPADNEYSPDTLLSPNFAYAAQIDGSLNSNNAGASRQVGGRIIKISGRTVTVKTSNHSLYTIEFPNDAVTIFNTRFSSIYNASPNFRVGEGTMLAVTYYDPDFFVANEGPTTIQSNQIESSTIAIKPVDYKINPTAPAQLY